MENHEQRITYLLNKLYFTYSFEDVQEVNDIGIAETFYKEMDKIPEDAQFSSYSDADGWGGKRDSHFWFVFDIKVPADYENYVMAVTTDCHVWHASNPQFIVYVDGQIIQGLDENHTEVKMCKAGKQTVWLYAYTGSEVDDKLKLSVKLVKTRKDVRRLFYQLYVLNEIISVSDKSSREYRVNLEHIKFALSFLDFTSKKLDESNVASALTYLNENAVNHNNSDETVYCVGQTHIDVEWLWTLAQTKEKVQRSFSSILNLMDEYKDSTFFAGTPIIYEYIKQTQPQLFAKIKELIKEGRWEADGGMWVESDTVLSGGESLIRQFVYGKKYLKNNFDTDSKIVWLPDCFGFSATLPQIAKDCGMDWLITSKISWNEVNQFPHDIFEWQGIDGSKIKTYFLTTVAKEKHGYTPATAYNGMATAKQMIGTCDRLTDKELSDIVLLAYGWGDGGGGPTTSMYEQMAFMKKGIVGLPKIKTATVSQFLKDLDEKIERKVLPKWKGELYLEYHRGTYTSISKAKRGNRKIETLLSQAEFLCAVNRDFNSQEEIEQIWKKVLIHQFHDALPGSSIKAVYDEIFDDYNRFGAQLNDIIKVQTEKIINSFNLEGDAVIFNFNTHSVSGEVFIDGKKYLVKDIPPKGYKTVNLTETAKNGLLAVKDKIIENEFIKVTFDDNFEIESVIDKRCDREIVCANGKFNQLIAYMDVNNTYDAWELHQDYVLVNYSINDVQNVEYFNDGIRAGVIVERKFRSSSIKQTISLTCYSDGVDVNTTANWQEKNMLLKAEFDADIMADKATYNIQFGNIERSALNNTSYEIAQFEVPFHKFFDLSEGDYGVAVINDCKYGGFVKENRMSLTLIKSASYPYSGADVGEHEFSYSIVPHANNFSQSQIMQRAYEFNIPLLAVKLTGENNEKTGSFVSVDSQNVIIETVKLSEDGKGYIIRLYDGYNCKTDVNVTLNGKAKKIIECDMLENEKELIAENTNTFNLTVKNYQIKTIKVIM